MIFEYAIVMVIAFAISAFGIWKVSEPYRHTEEGRVFAYIIVGGASFGVILWIFVAYNAWRISN